MAWTIPDKGECESDIQSYVYQEDLEIGIADIEQGSYVRSGLGVSAQVTPNMTVNVLAGAAYSLGFRFPVAANAALAIATADATNPRLDYVVMTTAGILAVRTGTPAPINTIKPPIRTTGDVALAQVYIPAGATTITAIRVQDRRGMIPNLDWAQTETGVYDNTLMVTINSGSTNPSVRGGGANITGTVSHPAPIAGRLLQLWRARLANVVTTPNQILGFYQNSGLLRQWWRGNAANQGGFYFRAKMTIELWPAATVRLFCGMTTISAANVVSDTLAGDSCGLWHDTTMAATVLNFITRDNTTTTSVAIPLATALAAGQGYELIMFCKPNDTILYYKVIDLVTGLTLVDSFTTATLPRNTVFLGPEVAMSNGTANITVTTVASGLNDIFVGSPSIRA